MIPGKLFGGVFMLFSIVVYVPVFSLGSIFVSIYQKNVHLNLAIDKNKLEEQIKRQQNESLKLCTQHSAGNNSLTAV